MSRDSTETGYACNTRQARKGEEGSKDKGHPPYLQQGGGQGVILMDNERLRIRTLTPRECWRLMGFDDSDFEKAEKVNSNTQLYSAVSDFVEQSVPNR